MQPLDPSAKAKADEAAQIRAQLFQAGFTLSQIDRDFDLRRGCASDTLRHPDLAGERAISAALGVMPHQLWRTRYHATGQRKSRLDYSRTPTMAQRRNDAVA